MKDRFFKIFRPPHKRGTFRNSGARTCEGLKSPSEVAGRSSCTQNDRRGLPRRFGLVLGRPPTPWPVVQLQTRNPPRIRRRPTSLFLSDAMYIFAFSKKNSTREKNFKKSKTFLGSSETPHKNCRCLRRAVRPHDLPNRDFWNSM